LKWYYPIGEKCRARVILKLNSNVIAIKNPILTDIKTSIAVCENRLSLLPPRNLKPKLIFDNTSSWQYA